MSLRATLMSALNEKEPMTKLEQWYVDQVDDEGEITGFGPGVCFCGKKGYHIECQEKRRPEVELDTRNGELRNMVFEQFGYRNVDVEDLAFIQAEKRLIKFLEFVSAESKNALWRRK